MNTREALLELIPTDGTPVLNRVMRVMIGRKLGRPLDAEEYYAARNQLQSEGRIGVTQGQGGKVFLLAASVETEPEVAELWSEAALMPRLHAYLKGAFLSELDLPEGAAAIVQDVSRTGPREGQWTRPDFVLVSVAELRFVPERQLGVHTFELKAEHGGTVQAVHEALAQTRFSHFGHLVWHLPDGSPAEARLAEIESQCILHGIGLILMRDPNQPEACDVRIEPTRRATLAMDIDGFLGSRLSVEHQRELLKALGRSK